MWAPRHGHETTSGAGLRLPDPAASGRPGHRAHTDRGGRSPHRQRWPDQTHPASGSGIGRSANRPMMGRPFGLQRPIPGVRLDVSIAQPDDRAQPQLRLHRLYGAVQLGRPDIASFGSRERKRPGLAGAQPGSADRPQPITRPACGAKRRRDLRHRSDRRQRHRPAGKSPTHESGQSRTGIGGAVPQGIA